MANVKTMRCGLCPVLLTQEELCAEHPTAPRVLLDLVERREPDIASLQQENSTLRTCLIHACSLALSRYQDERELLAIRDAANYKTVPFTHEFVQQKYNERIPVKESKATSELTELIGDIKGYLIWADCINPTLRDRINAAIGEEPYCITVDGVELTAVLKLGLPVNISRVIGRDRERGVDITSGIIVDCAHADPAALTFSVLDTLRRVAALPRERCTCDYGYGWSDHAKHCRSIYVAVSPDPDDD